MKRPKKSGFTLLELLVVVIIIGILASLAIPQLTRSIESSRGAEARQTLGRIYQAQAAYYAQQTAYTIQTSDLQGFLAVPADSDNNFYFKYSIPAASSATFTVQATRKSTGGKTPPWTNGEYTVTIDQNGNFANQPIT